MQKPITAVPLNYPDFAEELPHRLHFLEGPSLRRQRAIQLISHATVVSRQTSGIGKVLVSVGIAQENVRLFERLVEAIGDLLPSDLTKAGFNTGYVMRPDGIPHGDTWMPNSLDSKLPIARIYSDNARARDYSWQARAMKDQWRGADNHGLPDDLPDFENTFPWDPNPVWQCILELTEADRLQEAIDLVDTIPGRDREPLFDEVLYLRFLTNSKVKAQDIRLLARKHAGESLIGGRLLEEFDQFLENIDRALEQDPPVLEHLARLTADFGSSMVPPMPPASDWPALRKHLSGSTTPGGRRGRIFSVNISLADTGAATFFASTMIIAENAFRRERSIPEIGRGWVSEVALLDLVRTLWPSAIHQWRPSFLGHQSIDIYIPEIGLALEYQGQQHYEPVALFGGQIGLDLTQARDDKKRALLAANRVRLLEWRFDAPVTKAELVRQLTNIGLSIP